MDVYGQIGDKMREIAGTKVQSSIIFTAQVSEITGQTCTVKIDDFSLTDVRLRAVINTNDEQLLIKPKVGSYVLIADLSGGTFRELAVIGYSEIDEVNIKVGETTTKINKDGISFNGGNLGGMVKVEKLVEKLNRLEQRMATHQHICASPTSPTTPDPATNAPIAATQKSELENIKIKH